MSANRCPDLINLIEAFSVDAISVDAYSGHVLEQWINTALAAKRHHPTVRTMRAGPGENPARYDHLRSLARQGLVHLPQYELTRLELNTIQQEGTRIGAPTSGPCQTDDTVDALMRFRAGPREAGGIRMSVSTMSGP